jgi:polygalacturonase
VGFHYTTLKLSGFIDGFDCSTNNLVIQDSVIHNQDDCLAINKGTNITFQRNSCTGGHGISIGSISSDATVNGIVIKDNVIINKCVRACFPHSLLCKLG